MNLNPSCSTNASTILLKYQEQNLEIIKSNVKLNERIAVLEKVISGLQQENLNLRLKNCEKKNKGKSRVIKEKKKLPIKKPLKPKNPNKDELSPLVLPKRSSRMPAINYTAPSLKAKLRKGDPHTFGLTSESS